VLQCNCRLRNKILSRNTAVLVVLTSWCSVPGGLCSSHLSCTLRASLEWFQCPDPHPPWLYPALHNSPVKLCSISEHGAVALSQPHISVPRIVFQRKRLDRASSLSTTSSEMAPSTRNKQRFVDLLINRHRTHISTCADLYAPNLSCSW
jgi:hypothetical protein